MRILQFDSIQDVCSYAKEVTSKAREEQPEKAVDPVPVEKKMPTTGLGKDLYSVMEKSDFGEYRKGVYAITRAFVNFLAKEDVDYFNLLNDEDCEDEDDSEAKLRHSYPLFSVIMPLSALHGSDYRPNHAFVVIQKDDHHRANNCPMDSGEEGNHFYGSWRFATDQEINALFDKYTKRYKLKELLANMSLVQE